MVNVYNESVNISDDTTPTGNSSLPGQNGCHFADDIFRCIFVNEKFYILNKISLKFDRKGQIDNSSALV